MTFLCWEQARTVWKMRCYYWQNQRVTETCKSTKRRPNTSHALEDERKNAEKINTGDYRFDTAKDFKYMGVMRNGSNDRNAEIP